MKSKYLFEDHKEEIEKEHQELETYEERTKLDQDRCTHKDVEIYEHEMRCKCGAAWHGTALELQQAYIFFKNQN